MAIRSHQSDDPFALVVSELMVCMKKEFMIQILSPTSFKTSVSSPLSLCKKPIIHQVTNMLATSKCVLFPGHNHLLTTDTDDPSLAGAQAVIKVSGHQYLWLAGGYEMEI